MSRYVAPLDGDKIREVNVRQWIEWQTAKDPKFQPSEYALADLSELERRESAAKAAVQRIREAADRSDLDAAISAFEELQSTGLMNDEAAALFEDLKKSASKGGSNGS